MDTFDLKNYSKRKKFNSFVGTSTFFLLELSRNKIYCHEAEEVVEGTELADYRVHFQSLRKDVFFSSDNRSEALSLHNTIYAYNNLKQKKKIFCRNENYYLVKKYFTEGAQYVKRGEIHTYQPHGQPLDIYISTSPLEPQTLIEDYSSFTTHERISPGETKNIPSDTHYFVLAPCHTFFVKDIKNVSAVENFSETSPLFSSEDNRQVTNVAEGINGFSSGEETNRLVRTNPSPQPSTSKDNGQHYDTPSSSKKRSSTGNDSPLKRGKFSSTPLPITSTSQPGHDLILSSPNPFANLQRMSSSSAKNGSSSSAFSIRNNERCSSDNDPQEEREILSSPHLIASTSQMEHDLVPPSPNSLTNLINQMSQAKDGNSVNHGCRTVFAIRKDSNVESYALMSDSNFRVLDDSITAGSFKIANNDMDPYVIEYHGDVQYIKEIAKFKNGSAFETTLPVQKELLDELRDSSKKKEKVVVNYFFEYAFKTIEATYKKFSEMRYTKMIGSCVPAIVGLKDSRFWGDVSDAYEAKP